MKRVTFCGMALTMGDTAPYAPPATVIEVVTRYRERGMTTPFTTDVLERAGIPESLTRRTMHALKLLEIVDAEGNPTPQFEAATRAPDSEYKERLSELILSIYGEVLQFADPANDAYDRVRDAFRGYNPRGQQDRMVTLFLGLLDFLGVDTSKASGSRKTGGAPKATNGAPRTTKPKPAGAGKPSKPRPDGGSGKGGTGDGSAEQPTDDLPPGLVGLLRQIPRGGAGWPQGRRDTFMAAFEAVLDFTVPVRDTEPAPTSGLDAEVTAS